MTSTRTRPQSATALAAEISNRLAAVMALRATQAAAHGTDFAEFWHVASQCAQGGKLLRPRLLLGLFDALRAPEHADPAARTAAIDLAAAVELLHFSFLLHDDLIDEDLVRRGVPNLIGRLAGVGALNASNGSVDVARLHWARSSALLAGDLMLTIAHQMFARVGVAEAARLRALDVLDTAVTETVAGEYVDVGLSDEQIAPTLTLVLEMTRMKTATYTFELPLRLAAIVAGAEHAVEQRLGDIGRHLGVAFQLQDDLLSAFDATAAHGKDLFSDFREGKETALIACARLTSEWPHVERLLQAGDLSASAGRALQRLLESCGARAAVEAIVQDQLDIARGLLVADATSIPPAAADFLLDVMEQLRGRRA